MRGSLSFVLCREVILFWSIYKDTLNRPLLRGLECPLLEVPSLYAFRVSNRERFHCNIHGDVGLKSLSSRGGREGGREEGMVLEWDL